MNGLQSITQWQTYFGNPSGEILGIVNAAQSIGSVVSLPVVGYLSDKIGRRWTLFSGTITIIVASAIQAASVQYGMFVFSRYRSYFPVLGGLVLICGFDLGFLLASGQC